MESSFSLVRDGIGWIQSKTVAERLREKVVVRLFSRAHHRILACYCAALCTGETENNLELTKEAEGRKLHRMAKVHEFLDMWLGSHNLCATLNESCTQKKQMTAVGCISDTEVINNASWWHCQHAGAAAFELSEISLWPPALSAKDIPEGWTPVLNVRRIRTIDGHPSKRDLTSAPDSISATETWLHWPCDLNDPNETEDDSEAENEYDIESLRGIKLSESPVYGIVSSAANIPELI